MLIVPKDNYLTYFGWTTNSITFGLVPRFERGGYWLGFHYKCAPWDDDVVSDLNLHTLDFGIGYLCWMTKRK